MTEERLVMAELLEKAGESDFLRAVAEAVSQLFTRPVGLVLAVSCVATALIAHTKFADRNQEIHFLKNMAMMGGFLYVAAFGARAWSLDARWLHRGGYFSVAPAPHPAALPFRERERWFESSPLAGESTANWLRR